MTLKNEKEMGFFTFFSHAPVTKGMEPKTVLKPLFAFGPIRVLSSRLVPTDFSFFLPFSSVFYFFFGEGNLEGKEVFTIVATRFPLFVLTKVPMILVRPLRLFQPNSYQ